MQVLRLTTLAQDDNGGGCDLVVEREVVTRLVRNAGPSTSFGAERTKLRSG